MATYPIAVLNQSAAVTAEEAAEYCAAVQRQVSEHFAPFWGVGASLTLYPDAASAPADAAWVVFLDDSDSAGALGYHDLNPQGLPLGKVFAGTDRLYGDHPSVTFSHEVLELLGDPGVDATREVRVLDPQSGAVRSYAYAVEVCDPCEEDRWGYLVDDVLVSDFVTPEWYRYWLPAGSARFDFCGRMTQPLELLKGGYVSILDPQTGHWSDAKNFDAVPPYKARARVGSRRERRRLPRAEWLLSCPAPRPACR